MFLRCFFADVFAAVVVEFFVGAHAVIIIKTIIKLLSQIAENTESFLRFLSFFQGRNRPFLFL